MDEESKKNIETEAAHMAYLIFRYINNSLTEAEDDELTGWITKNEQNFRLFRELTGGDFQEKIKAFKTAMNN